MKKEKSKVALIIITIAVSIFMASSAIFQIRLDSCTDKVEELVDNRTMEIYWQQTQTAMVFNLLNLYAINNTNIMTVQSPFESDREAILNFTGDMTNLAAKTQRKIFELNDEISDSRKICKTESELANIFLYIGLVLNTIAIITGLKIYLLYRT